MSFTRLTHDTCAYKHELSQTVGPGEYQLAKPYPCNPCFSKDPRIRMQRFGASVSKSTSLIDVDSEMIGLSRKQTKCPDLQYMPECGANGYCGANSGGSSKNNGAINMDYDLTHFPAEDCFTLVEDTRLSDPPSNLRCTGWNRWEWLNRNPQDRVTIPFDYNINERLVAKDNHRPCVPNPFDQTAVLPRPSSEPLCTSMTVASCAVPIGPPSISWVAAERVKSL